MCVEREKAVCCGGCITQLYAETRPPVIWIGKKDMDAQKWWWMGEGEKKRSFKTTDIVSYALK